VASFLTLSRAEAVIMCYGVTSAGKTYTMQGTDKQPGLVPRALAHIFKVGQADLQEATVRAQRHVCTTAATRSSTRRAMLAQQLCKHCCMPWS
jgi:hypothetical protein